jgi:hypothetical protein
MIRGLGQITTVTQDGTTVQIPPGDVGGAGTPYYQTTETIIFPSDSGPPAVVADSGAGSGGGGGGGGRSGILTGTCSQLFGTGPIASFFCQNWILLAAVTAVALVFTGGRRR